jgi:hypothetical protein
MRALIGLSIIALAACEPEMPAISDSVKVIEKAENKAVAQAFMRQHCLRSPACDPTTDYGQGVGQASGVAGSAAWFAETKGVVKAGGADYGAALTLSAYGTRGAGGPAGRPLTIDEAPDTFNGPKAKRSTLAIEYRTPGGGAPGAYGLQFISPYITMTTPLEDAKLEIRGQAGLLYEAEAGAMPVKKEPVNGRVKPPEAVTFFVSRNLRDEPLPQLMAALQAGETMSVKLLAPNGDLLLVDALYAHGYESALKQATDSLADPEIGKSIIERCTRFASEPDAFWKLADVTPALLVCDPRPPELRR